MPSVPRPLAALGLAATLASGGLLAAVASSPAEDIQVVTAQTIEQVTAETVDPFKAAEVAFYQSTSIKPIPRAQSIKRITGTGGGFSLPANCNALCAHYAWAITDNIAIGLWGSYYRQTTTPPREVVLGKATISGQGAGAGLKLTLSKRYRARLRRVRKPVTVTIRSKIVDATYGFTLQREQKVTLKPSRR